MKRTTLVLFTVIFALTIGLLMLTVPELKLITQTYAQSNNETSEGGMKNMTNATTALGKIPSMSTPGEKTFYIFTSEIANVAEEKLKVAGDYYSLPTIVANKGDKVTVKFYNVDDVKTERHSFTIGDPYKVDIDLGFAQNGNATFTADQTGASNDWTVASATIIHISNDMKKARQDLN
jgi:FtsP/CotA-like multicopper oxidase with cupredoxin domain